MSKNQAENALIWIVNILNKNHIPYQIEGGLAANCYGSNRPLADIDIFIPSKGFEKIKEEVKEFVEFGPDFHIGTHWKLNYQILNYHQQQIELCDADDAKYLDTVNQIWIKRDIDFNKAKLIEIFGIPSKVISKDDLIDYKSKLKRDVDLIDIKQIQNINFK